MTPAGATAIVAAVVFALSSTALRAGAAGRPAPAWSWNLGARAEAGHTSDLFPGYDRSGSDRFTTLSFLFSARARLSGGTRIDGSASAALDRYQRWPKHDSERYEAEIRARRGIFRLKARGRLSPDILLFPDVGSDARYRSREGLVGIDCALSGPVVAGLSLRSEDQSYDPLHSGRSCLRTRWGYSIDWAPKSGPRFGVLFENEHSSARDSNYDFYDNQVTLSAEATLLSTRLRFEAAPGVRNYFTGSLFASNFYRHDRQQAWRISAGHAIGGGLDVTILDEIRNRQSTRPGRNYHLNNVRLAVEWKARR